MGRSPQRHGFPARVASKPKKRKDPFLALMNTLDQGLVAPASKGLVTEFQAASQPPARSYDARTDDATGDLLIEVSAPQANGKSFDIEVDDASRTLRIKEHWKHSDSHSLFGGRGRATSFNSGAFEKKWRLPSTVMLDAITADWDADASKLVVRMPVDHTENMLIEHGDDGSKSAVAPHEDSQSAPSATCSLDQAQRQQEYEQRMQDQYEQRMREYEQRRQEYKRQQQEKEQKRREEYERQRKEYERQREAYNQRVQEYKQKRQQQLNELRQQRQTEQSECVPGSRVKAIYAPNGQFYDAVVQAVDMDSGRVKVLWADGDTSDTIIPAQSQFIRGCQLSRSTPSPVAPPKKERVVDTSTSSSAPGSSASTKRKIVTDEQREEVTTNTQPETSNTVLNDDEFEIIEEWLEDDELEAQEKDDDASSGYFMFGEFHPY
eukprot:INCI7743.1.p2 GENE.INCI7743.1~~INCI7743.1.p2  ORF type:complete len:435 (-),score=93.31 INCI7743.1:1804-3108(-)